MLKQPTIDKRLQESQDVSVLVFSEQQGKQKKKKKTQEFEMLTKLS